MLQHFTLESDPFIKKVLHVCPIKEVPHSILYYTTVIILPLVVHGSHTMPFCVSIVTVKNTDNVYLIARIICMQPIHDAVALLESVTQM